MESSHSADYHHRRVTEAEIARRSVLISVVKVHAWMEVFWACRIALSQDLIATRNLALETQDVSL